MFISRLVVISCLRIFGHPAAGFFLKKVVKASAAASRMSFRRENFCSCKFWWSFRVCEFLAALLQDFFFKVLKVSTVASCMSFRREFFCSCKFLIWFQLQAHLTFMNFWPPCCRNFFLKSCEGLEGAILHVVSRRVFLQLHILDFVSTATTLDVCEVLVALLQIFF